MSLIRRQCRERRERCDKQSQQQAIIKSVYNKSKGVDISGKRWNDCSNADETIIVNETILLSQHTEDTQSFIEFEKDTKSSWNTYWRQMDGPPPYNKNVIGEHFCLVLKREDDNNFEIRYYVEESMERDPHCRTEDRAIAGIPISHDEYFGLITADWKELTSAKNGEVILSLAIVFPTSRHALSVNERNEEISKFKEIPFPYLFFLDGIRHKQINADFKKKCPVDCSDKVHHVNWCPLNVPKKLKDPAHVPTNPTMCFASFACYISTSTSANNALSTNFIGNEKNKVFLPEQIDLPFQTKAAPADIVSQHLSLTASTSNNRASNFTNHNPPNTDVIERKTDYLKINFHRSIVAKNSTDAATRNKKTEAPATKRDMQLSSSTSSNIVNHEIESK